jgi:hypothetical protein
VYSLCFFILDGQQHAERLVTNPAGIIQGMKDWLKDSEFEPDQKKLGLQLVKELCQGKLPADCSLDHFWAFEWLCECLFEPLDLPELKEVNSIRYLDSTGIWSLTKNRGAFPFPVPRSRQYPPGANFIPSAAMADLHRDLLEVTQRTHLGPGPIEIEMPSVGPLPMTTSLSREEQEWGAYQREEFAAAVESLIGDKLDLTVLCLES